MTNKEQIIINCVNVSGCKCYNKNIKTDCLLYPLQPDACKNNPNCYFKQLARKTQELETICKAFNIEYGYDEETGAIVGRCNKLIEKENELEEYKQSLNERNKFLQDLGISAGGEFKRIKFYIENLKNKYNENARYRKALKEIEEFCITYSDNHDAYETVYKYILNIINKAKEEE